MGGLKALEKVNTLIKQSDGGQLTDDQEKAIERMIIGGLEETQKNVDVQGTPRAAIPKAHERKTSGDMNKQIVELAKLVDEATSRINYKKAAVARPQFRNQGSNQQLAGTILRKFINTKLVCKARNI